MLENRHKAVVKLLGERDSVEADSRDKYGRTPLSYAAEKRLEMVAKQLPATESL